MMPAVAMIPRPARGNDARARSWWSRTAHTEGRRHFYYLSQLAKRGRSGTGWLNLQGELLLLGSLNRTNSLHGWKDFIHPDMMTDFGGSDPDHAGIQFYPLLGVRSAEGAVNAYIQSSVLPSAWPGISLNHHSIAVLLTSNRAGAYTAGGAMGTGGALPIMIRGSSGFMGGVWLNGPQNTQGGTVAAGFHMGSRLDENFCFGRSGGVLKDMVSPPAAVLANNRVTLLGVEPAQGNSPETLLVFWLGETMSKAQAEQFENDAMRYVRDIGTWAAVDISPLVLGTNCFGPSSLNQVVPASLNIVRQRPPPADDYVSASSYIGYPLSSAQARFFTTGLPVGPLTVDGGPGFLVPNPFTLALGSHDVVVTHAAHGLVAQRDVVEYAGAAAGGGLLADDFNKRFIVDAVLSADTYRIIAPVAATAAGAVGGGTVHAQYRIFRNVTSSFSFPRSGYFDCFQWSNRGMYRTVGGAKLGADLANDPGGAAITRRTAGPGGLPPAGILCRPGYQLHREAAGATVVQLMHLGDALPRNDARIPALSGGLTRPGGWGYLDVAEHYGLDATKVITWQQAYLMADDIFLVVAANNATSYGYVILQAGTMANVPNIPLAKKGVVLDLEHQDKRDPDLLEEMFTDMNCAAVGLGFKFGWMGHFLTYPQGPGNGFSKANIRRIQQLSNMRGHGIIGAKRADPAAARAWLQSQADTMRGENDDLPIDYSKILLSVTLGNGEQQVPLDQCTATAQWIAEKGIRHVHVRRAAQFEGGVKEHFWNQQQVAYFPNLLTLPPQTTALEALDAWINAVAVLGWTVSLDARGHVLELLNPLVEAGIFAELEVLTVFGNESSQAVRVDLKNLRAGALRNTATLIPNKWMEVDGVSGYYDHLWMPSESLVMTGPDEMLAVFTKDEIGLGGAPTAAGATFNAGLGSSLRLNPDITIADANLQMQGAAGFESTATTLLPQPGTTLIPDALYWVQKRFGLKQLGFDNTVLLSAAMTTNNDALVARSLYTGCLNLNNTTSGFKAGKRLATVVGKSQTPANMKILSDAFRKYFAAVAVRSPT